MPERLSDEDTFEVTDANLANSWPQLNAWLDDTADYESKRDILLQRAERWANWAGSRAYLARGEELKGIERFEDESETLDEFIAASKSGKRQFVVWAGIAGSILVIVLLFLAWRSWELSDANSKASQAEAQAARADAAAARAELSAKRITQDYNMVVEQRAVAEPQLRSADAGQMQISDMKRLDVQSLKGAIWLGSDKVPQVSAAKWKGEFTYPSKAMDGTPYRVLADVNLRDAMPPLAGEYKSPPKKAVVRAGPC